MQIETLFSSRTAIDGVRVEIIRSRATEKIKREEISENAENKIWFERKKGQFESGMCRSKSNNIKWDAIVDDRMASHGTSPASSAKSIKTIRATHWLQVQVWAMAQKINK